MLSVQAGRSEASRSAAPRKRHPTLRAVVSRHRIASIVDSIFATDACDARGALWIVWVEKCGRALLQRDGDIVASLEAGDGAGILHRDECPFARAEDLLAHLTRDAPPSRNVRESLETDLARWIAQTL